jgi:hypothetical protein
VGDQPEKSVPSRPSAAEFIEEQRQRRAAQEAEYAAQMAARDAERAALEAAIRGPLTDVEFGGGTIGTLIEVIQSQASPRPNIVADSEVLGMLVGPLVLKQVSVRDALTAAITAADAGESGATLEVIAPREPNPLYRLVISARSHVYQSAPKMKPILQVFPIKEWAGTPEVTLSAIETALLLQDGGEKPKVSFHKDSGLLFVSGSPQDAETVKSVLEGLEQRANSKEHHLSTLAINEFASQWLRNIRRDEIVERLNEWRTKSEQYDRLNAEGVKRENEIKLAQESQQRELEDVRRRASLLMAESQKRAEEYQRRSADAEIQAQLLASENKRLQDELEALKAHKSGGK